MGLIELKQQIDVAKQRAYSLKTKKDQEKAWDKVKELKREALKILYAQRDIYATHSVKATVNWFHEGDDYVSIITPYGRLWASPTSDVLSKSWYGHTCCIEYTKGQEIIVEIEIDVDSDRLCLEVIPRRIYGGKLNETKYAELCKKGNLAFFKYPDGYMSGLFPNERGAK